MVNVRAQNTSTRRQDAPRLVLISAEPDTQQESSPLRILGSEPRLSGNFRLTDR